ncbi:protein containing MacB-like periplasmic core domain [Bacteroidales bacterium 6E]|nr:protein containing MacB-like periplasmic core domain [Bacteroidales bacterium 6E]
MNHFIHFVQKTFLHYFRGNMVVALGVAISTAVLTGGLIIGDSVTYSLEKIAHYRLGNITHSVTVNDRYFRSALASELADESGFPVSPVLMLDGMAVTGGGASRVNSVTVNGIDDTFAKMAGSDMMAGLTDNDVVISANLAARLEMKEGDSFMLRVEKASLIPRNAPFISDTETSVAIRVNVRQIAGRDDLGLFNLKNSQSSPYNVFISIDRLNRMMEFEGKANRLLISAEKASVTEIQEALRHVLKPADGGLALRDIPLTGEKEISTERVFMEESLVKVYDGLSGSRKILTYFVNSLQLKGRETPYSFVSAVPGLDAGNDEVILNRWCANDLDAKVGDTIRMVYFEIGPLRQLEEKEVSLRVREIVEMEGPWADGDLMPHLPGLSDAGHCREWEAGIPVDLEKIRQKDEDYWAEYKGLPKAFVSPGLASGIWANRFGNYTAIRVPAEQLSEDMFYRLFSERVEPSDIGMMVHSSRESGLEAARGGVSFSQLFLGLSFFLLLGAILLSVLLFRLNLENRSAQTGTLMQLGFSNGQIFKIILTEAFWISLAGIIPGIILAVGYTVLVFSFLNTLWWDIVRTEVLFVHLRPATLSVGAIVSLVVMMVSIIMPVRKYLRQKVSELHRKEKSPERTWVTRLKMYGAILLPAIAVILLVSQFVSGGAQNPAIFFVSGGLLLPGLILVADRWLGRKPDQEGALTIAGLAVRNLRRNKSRSIAVIILFALGTFIVVSTGANRQDMFAGAEEPTRGSGGFHFFAESSVPVLFDLNDAQRRATESLPDSFSAVQFHRVDGDDASCLNLNLISNPAILGVDPEMLRGRFRFATKTEELDEEDPWMSLNASPGGNVIPAIADQTVIQWGLGLKVGDTLVYQSESGDTLKLHLVGGLAPSIFQGFVIIANHHFLQHYPSHSGSSVFLIDDRSENHQLASEELASHFRDFGWEMEAAPKRLAEFYSVTNTYLSIFLALGALGLALGTIGLAVILARSILERKQELAILQALGFRQAKISALMFREYGQQLLAGTLIGFVAALLATLPALLSENAEVSFSTIGWVTAAVLVNGFIWIRLIPWYMIRQERQVAALRDGQ